MKLRVVLTRTNGSAEPIEFQAVRGDLWRHTDAVLKERGIGHLNSIGRCDVGADTSGPGQYIVSTRTGETFSVLVTEIPLDPTATLRDALDLLSEQDTEPAIEALESLIEWLKNGGAEPDVEDCGYCPGFHGYHVGIVRPCALPRRQ